jgi:hypothetical protein
MKIFNEDGLRKTIQVVLEEIAKYQIVYDNRIFFSPKSITLKQQYREEKPHKHKG